MYIHQKSSGGGKREIIKIARETKAPICVATLGGRGGGVEECTRKRRMKGITRVVNQTHIVTLELFLYPRFIKKTIKFITIAFPLQNRTKIETVDWIAEQRFKLSGWLAE